MPSADDGDLGVRENHEGMESQEVIQSKELRLKISKADLVGADDEKAKDGQAAQQKADVAEARS